MPGNACKLIRAVTKSPIFGKQTIPALVFQKMEALGYLIINAIGGAFDWLARQTFGSRGGSTSSWLDKAPWWLKALGAICFMLFLVMLTFVILHFVLGPDAQGNSRVF